MCKKVFVSADWKEPSDKHSWDKKVVDRIRSWSKDKRYGVNFECMDDVHNSVIETEDCRRCDIKDECGNEIEKSDLVIFVVGDRTKKKLRVYVMVRVVLPLIRA